MAPLINFRFLPSGSRWLAAGHENTPAGERSNTKPPAARPGQRAPMEKTSPSVSVDEVSHHHQPSQPPYLLPADALPMPPIDMSTLDPNDDSLGRDFSLTCIHDLRTERSLRVPDECFLVPKHHDAQSASSPAYAHQLEPLRPAMHLGSSARVVDQIHNAQSMLMDDCALRSVFAILVLVLVVLALIPLDWSWFSAVPVHSLRGCGCHCKCPTECDEEKAVPYSDDAQGDESEETGPATHEASCMQDEKQGHH